MAKTKTPKVKDLRPDKISDIQLKKVQGLVNAINRAQLEALFAARQRQQPQGMPSPIAGLPSIFNTAAGAM